MSDGQPTVLEPLFQCVPDFFGYALDRGNGFAIACQAVAEDAEDVVFICSIYDGAVVLSIAETVSS